MAGETWFATVPLTIWENLGGLLGIGVALAGINFLTSLVRSLTSGWWRLAKVYRADVPPRRGPLFASYEHAFLKWWQPMRNNRVMLTEQGVYLRIPYTMFRPFQPPLLLPWPYFGNMEIYSSGSTQLVRLHFRDPAGRSIWVPLPREAIPRIHKMSGRNDFSGEALR